MFKIPAAVVGMPTNLYLSAEVAQSIDAEAQYIRNRAFDNQYYRDMIVNYLQSYGKASRQDIRNLLWDKLPDVLDDKQKEGRISTLLTSMRKKESLQGIPKASKILVGFLLKEARQRIEKNNGLSLFYNSKCNITDLVRFLEIFKNLTRISRKSNKVLIANDVF